MHVTDLLRTLRRRLATFLQLSWQTKVLVAEAWVLLGVARLAIAAVPFRRIAPHLGHHMIESSSDEDPACLQTARAVGWAVQVAARSCPWESGCLVQAVAGKAMLRRRGIPSTLYLGVQKEGEALKAHAWIRNGPTVVLGRAGHKGFTVVSTFGD